MSQQERVSWVSLIVNALVGYWYFAHVLRLPGDTHLLGPGMATFVLNIIILGIFVGIASEALLRVIQRRAGGDPRRREQLDERDRLINLRAGRNAYVVLLVATAVVLSEIALTQWRQAWAAPAVFAHDTVLARIVDGPLTGPVIAQLLLLALTLAALSKYLTRIVSYRRGY